MKLYVYGLAERGMAHIPSDLLGLGNVRARIEPAGAVDAIVTDFDGSTLQTSRENILAHARVLDAVLEASTPLPFRFGTLVTPEKLLEFITLNEESVRSDLERVRGRVQMTARLVVRSPAPADENEGPGTRFLKERQFRVAGLTEAAAWLTQEIGETVLARVESIRPGRPAMATVAHLVAKGEVESYRLRFDEVCRQRQDISALRSGPWPPYNFVMTGKTPPKT